jgi:hypothetical protein
MDLAFTGIMHEVSQRKEMMTRKRHLFSSLFMSTLPASYIYMTSISYTSVYLIYMMRISPHDVFVYIDKNKNTTI